MRPCSDIPRMLSFCGREPIRYRDIIHDLDSPCPQWDSAMRRCTWDKQQGCVIREPTDATESQASLGGSDRYFVDSLDEVTLLARLRDRTLRLAGTIKERRLPSLLEWVRQTAPRTIETSHESILECLTKGFAIGPWLSNATHYTPAPGFAPRISAEVKRLSPADRPMWERFVERNTSSPMVKARGGGQAVVRDFLFMCMGLPVQYYAGIADGEMTGMASVNPMTRRVDEISLLYVDPVHRRKGIAASVLSVAFGDILGRGRLAGYCAGGGTPTDRPDLYRLLTSLGCELVACSYAAQTSW